MSMARTQFLEQLRHVGGATQDASLIQVAPANVEHNERARILRNGLCVVGFVQLEAFLKRRAGEVVSALDSSRVSFAALPEALRKRALLESTGAVYEQAERMRRSGDDYLTWIQNELVAVASSVGTAYRISRLLFGHSQSNVNAEEISGLLNCLGVKDPWGSMERIGGRVGLGAPGLKECFQDAVRRRHSAAHDPAAMITTTDLTAFAREALAVAIGFDILLTIAMGRMQSGDAALLAGDKVVDDTSVRLRFIDHRADAKYCHRIENRKRAISVGRDANTLTQAALAAGSHSNNPVVVRGASQIPVEWFTPYFAP